MRAIFGGCFNWNDESAAPRKTLAMPPHDASFLRSVPPGSLHGLALSSIPQRTKRKWEEETRTMMSPTPAHFHVRSLKAAPSATEHVQHAADSRGNTSMSDAGYLQSYMKRAENTAKDTILQKHEYTGRQNYDLSEKMGKFKRSDFVFSHFITLFSFVWETLNFKLRPSLPPDVIGLIYHLIRAAPWQPPEQEALESPPSQEQRCCCVLCLDIAIMLNFYLSGITHIPLKFEHAGPTINLHERGGGGGSKCFACLKNTELCTQTI